jgi:hypothetical protein
MSTLFQMVKAGTTLLGTDPVRFFEFGTAPQLETLPYATWQELSAVPYNYLAGAPDTDQIKTQIDVWAETAADCRAVAREIRRALDTDARFSYLQFTWDEPSRLYRAILHVHYSKEI